MNNFPCHEALAIAQIESNFNKNAVGSLGEQGLFQVRPEFYGKSPKQLRKQVQHAIYIMKRMRAVCHKTLQDGWYVCWNRGIKGGLKRKRGTAYEAKATFFARRWKRILATDKTYLQTTLLRSNYFTMAFYTEKALVSQTKASPNYSYAYLTGQ
jgi:hypothetical protein